MFPQKNLFDWGSDNQLSPNQTYYNIVKCNVWIQPKSGYIISLRIKYILKPSAMYNI